MHSGYGIIPNSAYEKAIIISDLSLFFPAIPRWLILPIQNDAKKLKNDINPGKWVLI